MNDQAFQALEVLYDALAEELQRLQPVCRMSGACCRFEQAGHRLYVTALELEHLRARTGFAGADWSRVKEGACPFLDRGRCGVRTHRMLGCRVYYCDPAFQPRMSGLYEKYHERVKGIMRAHGLPYEYFDYLDRMRAEASHETNGA
ncbi:MAG: YkgJ family cysteine cluster protein [Planctomycetes bacterium]|nr:YkgJ family cysteine cluster protein [Planctomycetota bacterium]